MLSHTDFLAKAKECETRAADARSPQAKHAWLWTANEWRLAAEARCWEGPRSGAAERSGARSLSA